MGGFDEFAVVQSMGQIAVDQSPTETEGRRS